MTTLVPALTNALSGLVTSKSAIDVLSNNIANVNTEGYTRKIVRCESITMGGQGVGVALATVSRQVDIKLQKDILTENGILSKLDVSNDYYNQIQDLFGNTADNNSIAHLISDFSQRLQTLSDSPTAVAAQYEASQEAQSLTNRFNSMSEQLQYLRVEADRAVEDAVNRINEQLTLIKNLNDHVQREAALGKTTADLEDQRDVALRDLSKLIDIRINPQSDGTTMVFTTSGRPLIDVGGARLFDHTAVNALSSDMTKAGGNIDAITSLGRDLTSVIQGGELKALIDMRDTILPNLQSELDTVAKQFMDDLNGIHNRGVGYPTLQTNFNGSRSFVDPATQTIEYGSGDTVVGLFNSDGSEAVTPTTIKTIMGGSGPHTVNDVAAGLQNWLRTTGGLTTATVAVDSTTGKLNIALNSTGVGLAFRDQPMTEFTSTAYASDTTTPLGTATNLTITDSTGTAYGPIALGAGMSVQSAATWINTSVGAASGISASVVNDAGGYRLKITNTDGLDMTVTDSASSLSLQPTADQADASIRFDSDGSTTAFTGTGYATNWRATGGEAMTITDGLGEVWTITAVAGDTLATMASRINSAASVPSGDVALADGIKATVISDSSGNHLHIVDGNGRNLTFSADSFAMSGADETVSGLANFFGLNDLFVDGHDNYVYDTPVRASTWTTTGAATLNILDSTTGTAGAPNPIGSVTIAAGSSLQDAADAINNDTNASALVTAAVVPDGSGYRLRLTHVDNTEMTLTGSAVSALGLASTASGTSMTLDVRSDIKIDASLMSRGAMHLNSDSAFSRYELSEGSNDTVRAMVEKMSTTVQFGAAGNIGTGKYTYTNYGAAIISINARGAEVNKQNLEYQQPLNDNLESRQKNLSGVNLDEELASLIVFQTAYQAAARVVSVTQKMMDILDGIIN